MNWRKIGQIFEVDNDNFFLKTHAANPTAILLEEDTFRIYYSGRSDENKSSVGFIDYNIETKKIINYPKSPIATYGNDNSYYSHGISIGNSFKRNDRDVMLFMGWQFPKGKHWRGDIGEIEIVDNKFLVNTATPFMTTDEEDKVSFSYPWVIKEDHIYKMWYGSTINWTSDNGEMIHVIKYATSKDGIKWEKHGISIPYELGEAQAFSKPTVLKRNNEYHMWYSYRAGNNDAYKIGYSFSKDGVNWERQHHLCGIETSAEGWDDHMICYPYVFQHKNSVYMLYNGNEHGKFGFGLAILEDEQ